MVKIHQHVKFQAIPSMHSPANARKPLQTDGQTDGRTDGRTCRKTVTVGRVDQRTDVHVKRGYFRLRTDGRTDGQPENIMPPAPKGGGIKMGSRCGQSNLWLGILDMKSLLWTELCGPCHNRSTFLDISSQILTWYHSLLYQTVDTTVWCCYNAVNICKNINKKTGELWGVFSGFSIWLIFCLSSCNH